ncbi:MAG: carbohydrate-binding module family 14 protein [Bacteroidales bacterium]|jgi:hypothetical protein|nr:carbohydrate-binding module family 14 protein [Bacteroidales bacterium]
MKTIKTLALVAIAAFALTTLTSSESCPAVDPLDHTVILPNPHDDCSFFMCSNGVPILQKCPAGMRFNWDLLLCDWSQFGCSDKGSRVSYAGDCWKNGVLVGISIVCEPHAGGSSCIARSCPPGSN